MGFAQFKGGILLPSLPRADVLIDSRVLNAATEKWAVVFRVPRTGTLNKLLFRGFKTTLDAASAVRVSFQDVDLTTGEPDGIQDQFRDMVSGDFIAGKWQTPGLMTSDGTGTGTKRSVTRGDLLAFVIEYQTFTTGDSITVDTLGTGTPEIKANFPYELHDSGAGYSKLQEQPAVALEYEVGGTVEFFELAPLIIPSTQTGSVGVNSGSSPDEIGIRFRLAFPVKVGGAWILVNAAGSPFDLVLYDKDESTVLASVSVDPDVAGSSVRGIFFELFDDDVELLADRVYRLVTKPTTTATQTLSQWTVDSAALMDLLSGGQDIHRTHRTDGGAWSDSVLERPMLGLYLTAFDVGAIGQVGGGFSRGMIR